MQIIKTITKLLIISSLLISCNEGLKTESDLSESDIDYMKNIGLLSDNEKLILFDSQHTNEVSGNLITNKRLASYWIKKDQNVKDIFSAYYNQIDSITTKNLSKSWSYASFINVYKSDGTNFKVYFDGKSEEINQFFNKAINELNKNKK